MTVTAVDSTHVECFWYIKQSGLYGAVSLPCGAVQASRVSKRNA